MTHPSQSYAGQHAVLATMHGKEQAIAPVLLSILDLHITPTTELDTDQLGTFSGEIERTGTMGEVAIRKARLGMSATGRKLGLASEGTFGPHPAIPFVAAGMELMVFVDDVRGIVVTESMVAESTNFAHLEVAPGDALDAFLKRIGFPSHALIVRPNVLEPKLYEPGVRQPGVRQPGVRQPNVALHKGIAALNDLTRAIEATAAASADGRARLETDMRAHHNPTRMESLTTLAERLGQRLTTLCPGCASPGFGRTGTRIGLLCRDCEAETEMVAAELFTCPACDYSEERMRRDGRTRAEPAHCPECNP